ncbi:hypothetical protein GCM10007913_01060 [Devosia yakushimensis]|uniref:Uncharacterized protein n=1 Tax=Devosia yakushimensis TaxID=470028 RepID=A0ABQ5U8F0_9HYPH|nr:hypothetical protein GCM10007913_01060 [Devosia yakushimensis]
MGDAHGFGALEDRANGGIDAANIMQAGPIHAIADVCKAQALKKLKYFLVCHEMTNLHCYASAAVSATRR